MVVLLLLEVAESASRKSDRGSESARGFLERLNDIRSMLINIFTRILFVLSKRLVKKKMKDLCERTGFVFEHETERHWAWAAGGKGRLDLQTQLDLNFNSRYVTGLSNQIAFAYRD